MVSNNTYLYRTPSDILRYMDDVRTENGLIDTKRTDRPGRLDAIKRDFFHKNLNSVPFLPSTYEGNTLTDSLYSFIRDLERYDKVNPHDEEIKKALVKFRNAYSYAVESEVISRLPNEKRRNMEISRFIDKVQDTLSLLKNNESFIYSFGLEEHAMLFEFTRKEENGIQTFDIKLINSGNGLEHHSSRSLFTKYETYAIENASPGKVIDTLIPYLLNASFDEKKKSDSGFFKGIIDFICSLFSESKIEKMYRTIQEELIDKSTGKKIRIDDRRFHHKPQNYGICSRKIYGY